MKVLLVDFWSDKNRGDAAMQVALARLVRRALPGSSITVMTAFGFNQIEAARGELDETAANVDHIVGGFRPTAVPLGAESQPHPLVRKARTGVSVLAAVALNALWPAVARMPRVASALPRALRESISAVREADVVFWNGRNFRSDSASREAYELWQLMYNPRVCSLLGKQMACVGASVWPTKTRSGVRVLRKGLSRAYFVSAREAESAERLNDLLRGASTRVELLPDLSFEALRSDPRPHEDHSAATAGARPTRVAVTVVDWTNGGVESRDRYVDALEGLIGHMIGTGTESVVVVPQVTYEMEATSFVVQRLVDRFDHVVIGPGAPASAALADAYTEFDMLVATRMHSAIFASSRGVPVMTIPYDRGGKWGILDMIGASGISVPYDEATTERLVAKFEEVWARRAEWVGTETERVRQVSEDVELNVTMPLGLLGLLGQVGAV